MAVGADSGEQLGPETKIGLSPGAAAGAQVCEWS